MKTAATVLQEMMVKLGETPEFECISQKGPQHLAMFEYRCKALGQTVTAMARSKKEARQEAARLMLAALAANGHNVPSAYSGRVQTLDQEQDTGTSVQQQPNLMGSYVVLLKDLCEEYGLPAVEYELIGDTGPAHMRQFTMKATMGQHTRTATSSTKKTARQLVAQQLYNYLRENLTHTNDFVEEEALVRVHERIMERYSEAREDAPWRPDLGQKMDTCYRSVLEYIDIEKRRKALRALIALKESNERRREAFEALSAVGGAGVASAVPDSAAGSVDILNRIGAALGLQVAYHELPARDRPLMVVELSPTMPELVFVGLGRPQAAENALMFLELSLEAGVEYEDKLNKLDSPMEEFSLLD